MITTYPKAACSFSRISLLALLLFALQGVALASGGSISAIPDTGLKMLVQVEPINSEPIETETQTTEPQTIKDQPPKSDEILPYQAEYKISSDSLSTNATRTLSKKGNNWQLSQHAKLMFVKVNEESLIESTAYGLRPLRYEYSNNMSSKQDQIINFDWTTHSASDKKYRKPWSSEISDDTFDQLGAQLKMREMMINNRLNDEISLSVVNRGKHKTYTVKQLDEETIDSAVGKLRTVKLLRSRPGSSSETTIWLAKDWNYLIVKLEQREDDEVYSLELLKATLDGKTVKGL
ncbi:DUF3108 domain-containing protein [Zhongshania aliphaticivorans]|uniref:DUF3108 domain-containing protein n=1 Tax=Zhongshania aliphaticivorans TaxID=1470434 RepID=UPI0012E4CFD4|nr:DUF3108 domain-containing protein [Zhongshania aliphaticivorans]CAA0096503.1 Uncharacterised protein [Zhongshania aliphaticivorans]